MLRTARRLAALAAILTPLFLAAAQPDGVAGRTDALVGAWEGAIEPADLDLRIMVRFAPGAEGPVGRIDIPLQGAFGLPLEAIRLGPDGSLRFEVPDLPATPVFEGRLRDDVVTGTFRQRDAEAPFELRRAPEEVGVATPAGWTGEWRAVLAPGTADFELAMGLSDEDGRLAGTLAIPAQDLAGLALRFTSATEGGVTAEVPALPGDAVLGLSRIGDELVGTYQQDGVTFDVVFVRAGSPGAGQGRPQTPRPPFPYLVEEVTLAAGDALLAGTLTVPEGQGPFPAVLLQGDAGPQDRDATVAGHRSFLVLADHLTRLGLAVLRLDDRGVGGSGGEASGADHARLAQDAAAAVRWLAGRDDVDAARIGLLGHGEGGVVAARALVEADAPLAALVLLAAPAVSGSELLQERSRLQLTALGQDDARVEAQAAYLRAVAAAHRAGDVDEARRLTRERVEAQLAELPAERAPTGEARERLVDAQARAAGSPAFAASLLSRPRTWLRQVDVPTLALFGAADRQVSAEQNEGPMREALRRSGVEDVTVTTLPGLNHLLQPAREGAADAYATIRTTVAPEALDLIGAWLTDRLAE